MSRERERERKSFLSDVLEQIHQSLNKSCCCCFFSLVVVVLFPSSKFKVCSELYACGRWKFLGSKFQCQFTTTTLNWSVIQTFIQSFTIQSLYGTYMYQIGTTNLYRLKVNFRDAKSSDRVSVCIGIYRIVLIEVLEQLF